MEQSFNEEGLHSYKNQNYGKKRHNAKKRNLDA